MKVHSPIKLLEHLAALPKEVEWVEFKESNDNEESIGKYVSALANSAMLAGEEHGYLVFGVSDGDHALNGTKARLDAKMVGNDTFAFWLANRLDPKINVEICAFDHEGLHFEILVIEPGFQQPVRFNGQAYIRVDTSLQPLNKYPQRESSIWATASRFTFEDGIARANMNVDDLLGSIDHKSFLDRLNLKPSSHTRTIEILEQEQLIRDNRQGGYDATNLLALSAALNLAEWPSVKNKAPRVVTYKHSSKLNADGDVTGELGYAISFPKLLAYVMERISNREEMLHGVRRKLYAIPELAVRELLANALIHQDLLVANDGPTIDIFPDRIRITNPGKPLIDTDRFIDSPPKSRNRKLGDLLRRMGLCEERGSGVDRALAAIEESSLPAPLFQVIEGSTVVTIYGPKPFADLSKEDRVRACYQHACIEFEAGRNMSNSSLRRRFGLTDRQYPQVSVVIKEALELQRIRPLDDNQANRNARYVPYWA